MALLDIEGVTRRFGSFAAVDNVTLAVQAGEFFTLLGPSGCGKTTLLRMIAGFDLPDGGRILLNGEDLAGQPPESRPVRTVFQNYALFPHMTVEGNVAFPLQMARVSAGERPARIAAALEDVRLIGFERRYPHELSGGQKQRVAIARALVTHPTMLLLDEPLAALDAKLREELQIELINLQKEVGIAFVYVTHDQTEALALSHRIAVMNQGRVEQLDEPSKIYGFPRTKFVADFIGQCNLFSGPVTANDAGSVTLDVAGIGQRHPWPSAHQARSRCAPRKSASPRAHRSTRPTTTTAARSPTCCTWVTSPCTACRRREAAGSRRCSPTRRAGARSSSKSVTRSR
jgi:spermidine/putrescine transport system ATP-binding protein